MNVHVGRLKSLPQIQTEKGLRMLVKEDRILEGKCGRNGFLLHLLIYTNRTLKHDCVEGL